LTAVRKCADLSEQARADIARAFVEAVVDVLVVKSLAALQSAGLRTLVVAGGVGANLQLRERLAEAARTHDLELFFPPADLCTDNGAMIALAGLMHLRAGPPPPRWDFEVRPRWPLASA
ncbi:MAG: tRNA (adenosine(37)-N6)-threonylcarbamoyltransferase complex transferase subunit TsaD, partial [Burkholderiaceae bacterium]|nr:tRNA (adenosine(37)-N6)-threonylcarbamoyltransferase complex transferase subunit TsaD [Burkholderiaceae bacterium]